MDELTVFLNARLDEVEAAAKAVTFRSRFMAVGNSVQSPGGVGHPPMPIADVIDAETAAHIARHDPARVLREAAAMRAILAEHKAVTRLAGLTEQELGFLGWYREWVLKNLAAVWSDHPDYRQEWKP